MNNPNRSALQKIGIFLLVFLLAACASSTPTAPPPTMPPMSDVTATDSGSNSVVTPSVTVNDQASDGTSVTVADVVSAGPGWMVIHRQDSGGVGPPIGYTALKEGDNKDVVVKIDPGKATPEMYAMLHVDAGTVGAYEFPGPDAPVMANGQMLSPAFKINSAAASNITPLVKVSDEEITNSTVKVDEVDSNGPGWVVIHTHVNGEPGPAIGHIAVKDGQNKDVIVPIDASQATAVLYAILYTDAGKPGAFESPGADVPVLVNGLMIAQSFNATLGVAAAATPDNGASANATPTTDAYNMPDMGTAAPNSTASPPSANGSTPSVTVFDQALRGGTVFVSQIFSQGPGWVGIHIVNPNGSLGPAIGDGAVVDGLNKNLTVPLDLNLATPVMWVMLHTDKGVIGQWEFPGPDAPVMLNDQMVMSKFNVTGGMKGNDVTLKVGQGNGTPAFLTDSQGMSLYYFLNDTPGKSNCDANCRKNWFPLYATGKLLADLGVNATKLGVILLPNGFRQVTYGGLPLYYSIQDTKPGDTNGQGAQGLWFLSNP
jgi:predicted lipoprotein with Yx(FWY)xxD motif